MFLFSEIPPSAAKIYYKFLHILRGGAIHILTDNRAYLFTQHHAFNIAFFSKIKYHNG